MIKISIKNQKEIFLGFGLFVIAFIVRIYNLTIVPVFADEAIYIRWAQIMRAEQSLRFLPLSDGKQPLFMWLMIPFLKVLEDPLLAGRLVSVLSGLLILAGIYTLTRLLLHSAKSAAIASLFFAISPFGIFFDRLALADSLLSAFGIWTLIFSIITVRYTRLDAAIFTGFSLGGALLTKSPAVYFSVLTPLTLLLADWPKKLKDRFLKLSVYIFLFTFTYVIALLMYNILRLGPNFQMIALRNKDYVYPLGHLLSSPLDPLLPFLDRSLEYIRMLGPSALVLLILGGLLWGVRYRFKETLLLALWGFLPIIASSEFSRTMTARYIYFSLPYLLILASEIFSQKELKGTVRNIAVFLLTVFVVQAVYLDYQIDVKPQEANLPRSERSGYFEDWTSGYGIKEVSVFIKGQLKSDPGKKLVVGTEGYFGTLPDGLQIYLNNVPEVTVIGVGEPLRQVPQSLIESKKFGNTTYLLVNDTRLLADPDDLGLKLISSFPKAIKPDGSREHLLFFEVTDKSTLRM